MTGHPRIKFDPLPSECIVDQALVICIRGPAARERVTARLSNAAYGDGVLLSQAIFVADADGVVDLARHAPTSDSYQGIDDPSELQQRVEALIANPGLTSRTPVVR